MISLSDAKQADIIGAFNTTVRYLDDILNINNVYFDNMVSILPVDPHPAQPWGWGPWVGSKVKINFFRTRSCCILNSRESQMQQYGS